MRNSAVRAALVAIGVLGGSAGAARADVLSIGDDGGVTVYSAPMVYTNEGAEPIAPPRPADAPATSQDVRLALADAAARYGVSPALLEAVAWQESRLRQQAVSPKGAIGVMQLMPATARDLGVDPHDLAQNVQGGAAYLGRMLQRYGGDVAKSLAAYNAGPGAVDRHGGAPPYAETRAYVRAILGRLALGAR